MAVRVRSTLRLAAKRVARRTIMAGSLPIARLRQRMAPSRPRVRVLTYHRFAEGLDDPFAVSPALFADHVAWLAGTARVIDLPRLQGFLAGRYEPPDDAVLVTIDDGYLSTLSVAASILARHGVPAVAFVSAGLIDTDPVAPERYMTAREVAALADYGVAVGSHAWSHVSLGAAGPEELARELGAAREVLEGVAKVPVEAFAYPFGTRRDYSERSRAMAGAHYGLCFTSQHGAITGDSDALELPRVKIEGRESVAVLEAACRGGLDGWSLVDRFLWRVQEGGARPASPYE